MKYIKKMVDEIDDEIHSAKKYAERYVEYKASNDQEMKNLSSQFKTMSQQELEHAMNIHQMATNEITRLRRVYTNPPQEMIEKWEKKHEEYVEKVAWIKQMLTM